MICVHWELCQSVVHSPFLYFVLNDSEEGNFPNNELSFPLRKSAHASNTLGFHSLSQSYETKAREYSFLLAFNPFFLIILNHELFSRGNQL